MRRADLPPTSLTNVRIAVFGLGDSSYSRFNVASKLMEARLVQLGASKLVARGDGDDQHRLGLYGGFVPWMNELTTELDRLYPLPPGTILEDSTKVRPNPRYVLKLASTTEASTSIQAPPSTPSTGKFNENRPFISRVLGNTRITDAGWSQDVRHVELAARGLEWKPGDVVYIQPVNFSEDVEKLLGMFGKSGDEILEAVERLDLEAPSMRPPRSGETLRSYLASEVDISGIPRRYFFELLSHFATNEIQAAKLLELSSPEGQEDLHEYARRAKRSFLDVLSDFDSARPPFDYLLDLLPKLQPRAFSISSSASCDPDRLTISMVVVQYRSATNRLRRGVCSTWLSKIQSVASEDQSPTPDFIRPTPIAQPQDTALTSAIPASYVSVPIWIKPGTMTLPVDQSATPLIMVGPGTGCAIFRAFIEERMRKRAARGSFRPSSPMALAPAYFYFGCRHEAKDFLYKDLWVEALQCGALTQLSVAFSQDKVAKQYRVSPSSIDSATPVSIDESVYNLSSTLSRTYVQHCIKEDAKHLWDLIDKHNASVFVCGNSNKMPKDVRDAFIYAGVQSGLGEVEAENYVRNLEARRRYCVESWS